MKPYRIKKTELHYQDVKAQVKSNYDCLTKIDTIRKAVGFGGEVRFGIRIYNELFK